MFENHLESLIQHWKRIMTGQKFTKNALNGQLSKFLKY